MHMKTSIKKTLCAIGLCIITAGGLLTFSRYLGQTQTADLTSISAETEAASSAVEDAVAKLDEMAQNGETMTDAEMEELLSSILSAEQMPEQEEEEDASTSAAQETISANSVPRVEASAPSSASRHPTETTPAASGSAHSAASSAQSPAASAQTPAKNGYDEQLAKLIAQLYIQQDRYERELLEIIRQAHQEYVAYPEEERSLVLKVQVVLSKTGALTELEQDCNAEVDSICAKMETLLKENGQNTALVKEVRKTYDQKKADLKKELLKLTYSGADGSGSAGHWLYDRLGE